MTLYLSVSEVKLLFLSKKKVFREEGCYLEFFYFIIVILNLMDIHIVYYATLIFLLFIAFRLTMF